MPVFARVGNQRRQPLLGAKSKRPGSQPPRERNSPPRRPKRSRSIAASAIHPRFKMYSYSSCGPIQNQWKTFAFRMAKARYDPEAAMTQPPGKPRTAYRPASGSLLARHHTAAGNAPKSGIESSRPEFALFSKALFHRATLALRDFPLQIRQNLHSTATRREITFDPVIRGVPVAFAEPTRQIRLLLTRNLFNGALLQFKPEVQVP